jgi:hypothetical protein
MSATIHTLSRTLRPLRWGTVPAVVVLCALLGGPATADEPGKDDEGKGREAPPAEQPSSREAKGVTVLVPGWVPPADPRSFPAGITVLGKPPEDGATPEGPSRSEVSIVVVPRIPPPGEEAQETPSEAEEAFDLVREPERLQPGQEQPPETMGPSAEQQLAAFPREAQQGGSPVPAYSGWQPTSAYPDRSSEEPYPWNPAEFSGLADFSVWEPESAFPARDPRRPYPWNPANPPKVSANAVWEPTDTWGRKLGRAEVITPWRSESDAEDAESAP